MNINIYDLYISWYYIIIFLSAIIISIIILIIKRNLNQLWLGIVTALYSIFGLFTHTVAYLAVDDISDPNYSTYKDWTLSDFYLHDIKVIFLWIFIGYIVYNATRGRKKSSKKIFKILIAMTGIVVITAILLFMCFAI